MRQPQPLNVIQLGNEWIVTNGELAPDGSIRFPENDPAEEYFGDDGPKFTDGPPSDPTTPPSAS